MEMSITDLGTKCLFQFNSKGKLLITMHTDLRSLYSVKIIDNQLYVLDTTSQLVRVLDMELKVVYRNNRNERMSSA